MIILNTSKSELEKAWEEERGDELMSCGDCLNGQRRSLIAKSCCGAERLSCAHRRERTYEQILIELGTGDTLCVNMGDWEKEEGSMDVFAEGKSPLLLEKTTGADIKEIVCRRRKIPAHMQVVRFQGARIGDDEPLSIASDSAEGTNGEFILVKVGISGGLSGGKGGFGSMLRSKKFAESDNKDACRDLSGRRLRAVDAEKKVKDWAQKQKELEVEKEKKRKQKRDAILSGPRKTFNDHSYGMELNETREKMDSAVEAAMKHLKEKKKGKESSSSPIKRKISTGSEDEEEEDEKGKGRAGGKTPAASREKEKGKGYIAEKIMPSTEAKGKETKVTKRMKLWDEFEDENLSDISD
eukprot:Nk52_evm11s2635 gene=Nk52_evmTU11s2635